MEARNSRDSVHNLDDIRRSKESIINTDAEIPSDKSSWPEITRDLFDDFSSMMTKERELIRTEMREKYDSMKTGLITTVAGTTFLVLSLFTFVATAVIALNYVMDLWLASLLVAIACLVVGGIMVNTGKNKLELDSLAPRKSINTFNMFGKRIKERYYDVRQ